MEGAGRHRELGRLQGHPALLQHHHHQGGAVLQALVVRQDLFRLEAHLAETFARLLDHFA